MPRGDRRFPGRRQLSRADQVGLARRELVRRRLPRDRPGQAPCIHLHLGQRRAVGRTRNAGDDHLRGAGRQDRADLPPGALQQRRAPRRPCRRLEPGVRQGGCLCRDHCKGASSMITISAFPWVPTFARGQVRDLRVRWACEEAGLPYDTRLLAQGEGDSPEYRALQPFVQVPIFVEDGFTLFESGAIVLHIGERSEVLLPKDAKARARAIQWLFAALNSIEPSVMNLVQIDLFHANEEWAKLRRPGAEAFVRRRLGSLSSALGDKPFLDGDRFTAGHL